MNDNDMSLSSRVVSFAPQLTHSTNELSVTDRNDNYTVPITMEITNSEVSSVPTTAMTNVTHTAHSDEFHHIPLEATTSKTQPAVSLSALSAPPLPHSVTLHPNMQTIRPSVTSPLQSHQSRGTVGNVTSPFKDSMQLSNAFNTSSSTTAVVSLSTPSTSSLHTLHLSSPQPMSVSRPTLSQTQRLDPSPNVTLSSTMTSTTVSISQRRSRRHAPVNMATVYLMDTCIELTNIFKRLLREQNLLRKSNYYEVVLGEVLNGKYQVVEVIGKGRDRKSVV